ENARTHVYEVGRLQQKTNIQHQDELRDVNRANKEVESEKAAILQELNTFRLIIPFLQRDFHAF
ncbi:hypothetical protein Tco_1132505, partial [Tanacetum coccineum]